MENIYHEEDKIILIHVVEQLHLPFLAGMKTIAVVKCLIMYNYGQKSWDKFALLVLLGTRQTQIQLQLPNLTPHPPNNVENY